MTYQVIHPNSGAVFEESFGEDQMTEMREKANLWNDTIGLVLGPVEIRTL